MSKTRHIIAIGGGGFGRNPNKPIIEDYIINLSSSKKPTITFFPTASAEDSGYIANYYTAFSKLNCKAQHISLFKNTPDLKSINNVGSIFLGAYSPEAVGDYLAGPNHVLPTSGTAKFSSGLSVYDFLKRQSVIKMTKRGIERLGPSVITLSKYENLHGHANSIKARIKKRV